MNEQAIKVYDLKEVCSILKISLQVLRRYIKKGQIKASKIGRKYVITEEDLKAYIKGNSKSKEDTGFINADALNTNNSETNRATLDTLIELAHESKTNTPIIDIEDYIATTSKLNKTITKEDLEASLKNLLSLKATKTEKVNGETITTITNIINSISKTKKGYNIELNKDFLASFKENMLINVEITK